MACANCGSGGGSPRGCKNNGTCSSGGCNKLEVYDWLANMDLPAGQAPYDIVEVRFKNSRKSFYRNANQISLQPGDAVVVEASPGHDVGVVSACGELARIQVAKKAPNLKPLESKKIYRKANQEDIERWQEARALEKDAMYESRTLALRLNLEMKISDVEYQGDGSKATFYYTAESRVDFRQLIRDMADKFKVRIEMRQIGARQEASRLGGIGSCGRELCCSTWLTDFRSVSTSSARYQQLSLNPQKLAGQCGKLKCCLNFELDMYLEALKEFPKADTKLHTQKGVATHVKTDVFKRQMWFAYEEAGGLVPMHPERVNEIIALNKKGTKPVDLKDFIEEVVVEKEPDYTNVVGQDSLNRFDGLINTKKKKRRKKTRKPNSGDVNQQTKAENRPPKPQADKGPSNQNQNKGNAPKPKNQRRKPNKPKAQQPQGEKQGKNLMDQAKRAESKGENKGSSNNRRKKRPNNRNRSTNKNESSKSE